MTTYEKAISQLQSLSSEAANRGVADATSASLATCDFSGRPSVRTIYIEQIDTSGLLFFTNLRSGKGQQIIANPRVALCFFWPRPLEHQAIVEGDALIQSPEQSDAYWTHRSRESGLASWASEQTEPLAEKNALQQKLSHYKKKYAFSTIPRPEDWRAILIVPDRIDIWPAGWRRLRAKVKFYKNESGEWVEQLANP